MSDDDMEDFLVKMGYCRVRKLLDGTWVGLLRLPYATGLCVGLSTQGWKCQYSYESLETAIQALWCLSSGDETPMSGWATKSLATEVG